MKTVQEFLRMVSELDKRQLYTTMADEFFEYIDQVLEKGELVVLSQIIEGINIAEASSFLIRTTLTNIIQLKSYVKGWDSFFERAKQRLEQVLGQEKAERLLRHFEC